MSKANMPDIVWEDEDNLDGAVLENNDEFASMLENSASPIDDFRVGEKVTGSIVSFSETSPDVIIDIGAKGTAVIAKEELQEANIELRVGANIEAIVISRQDGDIILSRSLAKGMQDIADLQNAYHNKIPVKGKVSGENKGGFDIMIFSKKAFCPVSQIDLRFVEDKSGYIGQEFEFLITGLKGRDITVSRKALLKKAADERLEQILKNLENDNTVDGKVTRLEPFGAFVDIGGIEGLVHVSEISHGRVKHANELLQLGDKVRVKILGAQKQDDGKIKISMSLRALAEDPWDRVKEKYLVGNKYTGKVVSLMNFGAFVELERGIEGLIHISEMSWKKRINHPKELLNIGDQVSIHILSIKSDSKQIGLSLKDVESDPWLDAKTRFAAGNTVQGNVSNLKSFGAIIELTEGIEGMLPIAVMKKAAGDAYRKSYSPPKTVEVVIANFDESNRRILLTLPNIDSENEENRDWQEYMKEQNQGAAEAPMLPKNSSGSFGDLLQQSMDRSKK